MIEKINHYSMCNLPSIYDEEALTALELVARLAGQYNNIVDAVNNNTDIITYIKNNLDAKIQKSALELLNNMLENGAFAELVYNSRISVKTFGAVGDGVTDETEAFNTWLLYIAEHGATGYIPNGKYNIGVGGITIREKASFTIEGESKEHTVLMFPLVDEYVCPNHIDIRNCNNISLSDFTIHCAGGSMQTAGVGLYLVDVNNSQFTNIDIVNCSRGGVTAYSANYAIGEVCDNLYFDGVNIYGVENNALHPNGNRLLYPMGWILSDVINTTVNNSEIRNIRHYGFEFKNYCKNSWFINCNARRCGTACHIGGELNEGDKYGARGCGYKNITCYDVDVPILGGSFQDCVFDGITAYYSPEFKFLTNSQYSLRVTNGINSYFRVSIFNMVYGGAYFSENSDGNTIEFDYISKAPAFAGRAVYFQNSINNLMHVKAHALDLNIERLVERVGENIVIDDVYGTRTANIEGYSSYTSYGTDTPNRGITNESAPVLNKTYYSENGIPAFFFGSISGDNIEVRVNTVDNRVEFRFTKDGVKNTAIISPTGVTTV